MFQVGDHVILIDGSENDTHGVGWVDTMYGLIGQEFVIRAFYDDYRYTGYQKMYLNNLDGSRSNGSYIYDSAWLIPVEQFEPDPQELDDMFSEFE